MQDQFPLGSFENPVKCKGVAGEYAYLEKLVGPGGIPIEYERIRSTMGRAGKPVDVYEIQHKGLQEPMFIHLDMYAQPPYDKKAVPGLFLLTDFLKTREWQKLGYMDAVMQKEFGKDRIKLPENFAYAYAKAGILLAYGPYIYAKRDAFNLPRANWETDEILRCAEQMVHHLRGISPSHPIQTTSKDTAACLLETFHFETEEKNRMPTEMEGVFSYSGTHLMDGRTLQLYFSIKS